MKLQVRIKKKPFNKLHIVGLLKACDKSLSLKQAKDMVDEEIEQDVDDILEFNLPNGSLVNVNIHTYNPDKVFDIIAAQGDEIPDKLNLVETNTDVLKTKMFVLVRNADDAKWKLDIFSHIEDTSNHPYVCFVDKYTKCIPYEGNEHLLNTNHPTNLIPEPKYDNEEKRYHVAFGDECMCFTDQELYNFITGAVLHNRDIRVFTVVDTKNMPSRK